MRDQSGQNPPNSCGYATRSIADLLRSCAEMIDIQNWLSNPIVSGWCREFTEALLRSTEGNAASYAIVAC